MDFVEFSVCVLIILLPFLLSIIYRRLQINKGFYRKTTRIDDKVVLITGASSGIGKATAVDLAKRGGKIYIACCEYELGKRACEDIKQASGNSKVNWLYLNLASLQSVRNFSERFKKIEQKLDVLINNAGMIGSRNIQITKDNFEKSFQVNYLGHFLLTISLLELLRKSAPSRIIFVSSEMHRFVKFNRQNLNGQFSYQAYGNYSLSKLAILLFSNELAKRLEKSGVTVNSLHPGAVNSTQILQNLQVHKFLYSKIPFIFLSPFEGAQTQIMLAVDSDLEMISGQYFRGCKMSQASRKSKNEDDAKWLWEESMKMTNLCESYLYNENKFTL